LECSANNNAESRIEKMTVREKHMEIAPKAKLTRARHCVAGCSRYEISRNAAEKRFFVDNERGFFVMAHVDLATTP
jgi:hypothetical protein